MNAIVLEHPKALRRMRHSLHALAASAFLAILVAAFSTRVDDAARDGASGARSAAASVGATDELPLRAEVVPGSELGRADVPDLTPAPAVTPAIVPSTGDASRRPARRHHQPLAMPFFSFAVRS